jgi:hypothetical protein
MKNAIKMDEYLSELKRLRQADPKTLGSADLQKKAELEKSYPEFLSFVDQTAGFSKIGDFAPHQAVLDPATGKFLLIDLSSNHKKVIKENGEWFEVSTRNPSDRKPLKKTEKSIWSPYLKSRDYDPKTEADIQSTVRKSRGFGGGSPP